MSWSSLGGLSLILDKPARLSLPQLAALLDRAQESSPGELCLWTFQRNAPARRFYQRHGFAPNGLSGGAPAAFEKTP